MTYLHPKIILVRPQLQENIGATARAMANFTLKDLSLISPRAPLSQKAYAMSSGATEILDQATYYDTVTDALKENHFVLATTARHRDLNKPVLDLCEAIKTVHKKQESGQKCAFLFGPERTGLENDDLQLADALITVPVNPEFASLNLAQCVLLIGYEYFKQAPTDSALDQDITENQSIKQRKKQNATKEDLAFFLSKLTTELDKTDFFYPEEKRASLISLIENIFTRNYLTLQELGALHGIIKSISK